MGKRKSSAVPAIPNQKSQSKTVTVKTAKGGYIVSSYNDYGNGDSLPSLAKNKKEALKIVNKLFKAK